MAGTFGLAGKHADIKVKGHICTYTQNAPNNEYLGLLKWHALNNEYALISEIRLITRKYGICK